MPVDIVTFDLDGTIIKRKNRQTSTLKIDAINYAITKIFGFKSFNYIDLMVPQMYGMTDRSILKKILMQIGIEKSTVDSKIDLIFDEILRYFKQNLDRKAGDDYIILPGMVRLLNALRAHNIKLGLATGNLSDFAWWKLKGVGLDQYFTFGGFGEDDEERAKIVAVAMVRSGRVQQNNACHFGDTPNDIKAAKANKILAAAITKAGGGTFPVDALRQAGADLVVDSWHEVDKILSVLGY
jgi:phosphoglycolate phosphatase